jgi:hypothetical protein
MAQSNKRRTVSGSPSWLIPNKIKPFTEDAEKELVLEILKEIWVRNRR